MMMDGPAAVAEQPISEEVASPDLERLKFRFGFFCRRADAPPLGLEVLPDASWRRETAGALRAPSPS